MAACWCALPVRIWPRTDDDLVPVKLRRGGRILGGSLSWEKPQQLAAFSREGPFTGMPVPDDVTVNRQVLAEPDSQLTDRTWATLADGTPLVTAQRRGKGLLVLFHVTADTRWSDLPLAGTFVDMLRRIVALAGATATAESEAPAKPAAAPAQANQAVPATRVLDGFGAFSAPPPTARRCPANFNAPRQCRSSARLLRAAGRPGRGQYARAQRSAGAARFLRAQRPRRRLSARRAARPARTDFPRRAGAADTRRAGGDSLSGGFGSMLPRRRAAATLLAAGVAAALTCMIRRRRNPAATHAAAIDRHSSEEFAMKATQRTHLAYIITGDAEVDAVSKAGLQGLTLFLAQRTALEAGEPIGLDPARDELAFFPLIYWPVSASARSPRKPRSVASTPI